MSIVVPRGFRNDPHNVTYSGTPSHTQSDTPYQALAESELQRRFGGAVIDELGREIPITETMITQALLVVDGLGCCAATRPSAASVRR